MSWFQKTITLSPRSRGFHLVTDEILAQLPELSEIHVGQAHFFLKHTSASLSINENCDTSVRDDLENHFNVLAPENVPYFIHTYEGPDDMPAHIKSGLLGCELTVPVSSGSLALGPWQGIMLGEHRDRGRSRTIVVTISGAKAS